MPIEFRCTACGKLLRTQDDTAGKQAKCPHCGAMVAIPLPGGAEGPFGAPLPSQNPFDSAGAPPPGGMPTFGSFPPAGQMPPAGSFPPGAGYGGAAGGPQPPGFNPYQSPAFGGGVGMPFQGSYGPRSGPPWERDGISFGSFIATIKEGYSSPVGFFSDMRREGGLGAPMGFAVAGHMIGTVFYLLYSFGFQILFGGLAAAGQGGGAGNAPLGAMVGFGLIGSLCLLAVTPLIVALQLLISSGITHLMLMLVKGANFPYETTFRVTSYCSGLTSLLMLIPMCGTYVLLIVQIVFVIIGLIYAHETTAGKAVAAVLLPAAICCAVVLGAIALIFLTAVGAAANQGGGFNP